MSTDSKLAISLTPEMALAVEAGVKTALKGFMKDACEGVDPRTKVASDQSLKGVKITMDLTVDEVTIGHDTDKAPTASIPLLPAMALLVKRSGATRDATLKLLRECMEDALTLDKDATKSLLSEAGVEEAVAQIKSDVIGRLPRTPVAKPVKAKGASLVITGVSQVS